MWAKFVIAAFFLIVTSFSHSQTLNIPSPGKAVSTGVSVYNIVGNYPSIVSAWSACAQMVQSMWHNNYSLSSMCVWPDIESARAYTGSFVEMRGGYYINHAPDGTEEVYNMDIFSCPNNESYRYYSDINKCISITKLTNRPGNPKANGPSCTQPSCGNPITLGTGNKVQVETDFEDKGPGGLSVSRIYNGGMYGIVSGVTTDFGNQWSYLGSNRLFFKPVDSQYACYRRSDNYVVFCESTSGAGMTWAAALAASSGFKVSAVRSDGKVIDFVKDTFNRWVSDPDVNETLTPQYGTDGVTVSGWVLSTPANKFEYYDANGRIIGIKRPHGGVQKYTYSDGTTNNSSLGRLPQDAPICSNVQIGENVAAGHLLCVTDEWGRQLSFEYDVNARVSAIVTPNGERYEYRYDEATGGCVTYNAQNMACFAGNLTSVTYPDGSKRRYHYNESSLINGGNTCPARYEVGGGYGALISTLTGITDENGIRYASWVYDCNAQAGGSWHAGGVEKVMLAHDEPAADGSQTVYVNVTTGSAANPVVVNQAQGYQYQLILGVARNVAILGARCDRCGEFASRTYDARGNIATGKDWNGTVTQFTYEPVRNLETSRTVAQGTTAARQVSTVWHAKFVLPVQIWEPKKLTSFNYDDDGRLLSRTEQATKDATGSQGSGATLNGPLRVWKYTYSASGQLLSITGPRTDVSNVTLYTYDALGNLATVTDPLGHVTSYSNYDRDGRVGHVVAANGLTTDIVYNSRGWVTSRTVSDGTVAETTTFAYDSVGQLTKAAFPDGSWISYIYDPAHRLTQVTDTAGNRISYTLDNAGNRIGEQISGADGAITRQISRVFDVLNNLKQITGASQ